MSTIQTFLPYSDFIKNAKCLDYRRLGKQRVEVWQIYQALKQGEYKECPECLNFCDKNGWYKFTNQVYYAKCLKCKGTGKVKTAWYNHPITQMWKGYEQALLRYGMAICEEWRKRGFKDTMLDRFCKEYDIEKDIGNPKWLGNKEFHASHRSNLLRKNKEFYSKYNWKEPDNLPYIWIK